MRRILARRIGDPGIVQFTAAEYNEALNAAAARVQAKIMVLDPTAFLSISRQNIVSGTDLYPKPQNSWALLDLRLLNGDGTKYNSLGAPTDHVSLDNIVAGSTTVKFSFFGRRVKIAPMPTVSVDNGLEWYFVEEASIPTGGDNDGETYPFLTVAHELVVLRAELIMVPDFAADANTESLMKLIADAESDLGLYYKRTVGLEMPFQPTLRKLGQQ
jgi:hypothetical protein